MLGALLTDEAHDDLRYIVLGHVATGPCRDSLRSLTALAYPSVPSLLSPSNARALEALLDQLRGERDREAHGLELLRHDPPSHPMVLIDARLRLLRFKHDVILVRYRMDLIRMHAIDLQLRRA